MVRADWPGRGLVAVELTAAALVLAIADTPIRGVFTALLLLLGPGLAAAWSFRDVPWPTRFAIALAATVVANAVVAEVMLVTAWSPRGGVVAVAVLSGGLLGYGLAMAPAPRPVAGSGEALGGGAAVAPGGPERTPPMASAPPPATAGLRVEVVRPSELGATDHERWRALQRDVPQLNNPFLAPEFAEAVGRFNDTARVAVLSTGPEIVGYFPYEQHGFGIGRPLAAGLTDCQGLVHVPDLELDARRLLQACGLAVFEFDHLVHGQPFFEPYTTTLAASPIMDLSDGYDAYEAHLRRSSPKFLRTTLSKGRKLGRDVGELTFDYDTCDLEALRQLMRWKSDQYRRTGRGDRFAQPWIVALVEHLLDTRSTEFAGVMSMLYADGRPVSGHFGIRSEEILVGWFPAYDLRFARYSPGLVLHLRMAEAAATAGIRHFDLGKGSREYKDSLKSRELMVAEGRVLRRSPAAAAYWAVRAPVRAARNFALGHPAVFRMADRALKRYGRVAGALSARPELSSGPAPESSDEGGDRRGGDRGERP